MLAWPAPPESLLGKLQRGRGAGFTEALQRPGASLDLVLACVLDDPRWDRQVESRDTYYARLLLALHAPIDPILHALHALDDPTDGWLLAYTLAELARRHHAKALDALHDGLRTSHWWTLAIDALEHIGALDQPLIDALIARVGLDAARDHLGRHALLNDAPPPAPPDPDPDADATALLAAALPGTWRRVADLLAPRADAATDAALHAAARSLDRLEARWAHHAALTALGRRADDALLPSVEAWLRDVPQAPDRGLPLRVARRRGVFAYLDALPADLTLPLARRWLHEPDQLGRAALRLLARHATAADRTVLEEIAALSLQQGEIYLLCDCIEGLGHVGDPRSVPVLRATFTDVIYSYARARALDALLDIAPDAAPDLVAESLCDCEEHARLAACEHAPLNDDTRATLRQIASDPFEDKDLREAAQERLAAAGDDAP